MENIDKINRKILNILQEDCSITNNELAKRVGLAPATTLERVRKLENRGILTHYVAQIEPKSVDKDTLAFVELSLTQHTTEHVKTFNKEIKDFDRFSFEKLSKIPGIERCSTKFVLKQVVNKTKITLPEEDLTEKR